jgi:hypothetical protein
MELKFELPPSGFKRLFYDIETSYCIGSFWRPSWKANISHDNIIFDSDIICICWKWEGQHEIYSASWEEGCDKALLFRFLEYALKADEIVAHNGDRFDEPWIRTRCMVHGIECPPKFKTLDTLKKVRRHFNLPSNRLDFIGERYLDGGKTPMSFDDWNRIIKPLIPKMLGYELELPQDYFDALDKMVMYCKKDVKLLEDAFHRVQPYIEHNTHTGAHAGFGRWSCPKCGDDKPYIHKSRTTKAGTKTHQMKCTKGCGYFTITNAVLMQKLKSDLDERIATGSV